MRINKTLSFTVICLSAKCVSLQHVYTEYLCNGRLVFGIKLIEAIDDNRFGALSVLDGEAIVFHFAFRIVVGQVETAVLGNDRIGSVERRKQCGLSGFVLADQTGDQIVYLDRSRIPDAFEFPDGKLL